MVTLDVLLHSLKPRTATFDLMGKGYFKASIQDVEKIKHLKHNGIHNFSLGTLDAYFYLTELLAENKHVFYGDHILVLPAITGNGIKTYVYDTPTEAELVVISRLQGFGPVYSQRSLVTAKEGTFSEVAYHLPTVFDPASYPNKKKRHQKIRYPFSWFEKMKAEVVPLTESIAEEAYALHEKWVERKLADPKTYQIMFPRRRYAICIEKAVSRTHNVLDLHYVGYAIRIDGKIEAVRVVYIDSSTSTAFDLAFFGGEVPQLMDYADVVILDRLLKDHQVVTFNCGAALNKSLSAFKEGLPHQFIESYMYSKL